jgi:hypothetical protein
MKMSDDEARRMQKQLDDIGHIPAREEMRQLLERYFTGPISEDFVDLIESRFKEGYENTGSFASYASHFSSWTRWLGTAWYEDEDFTFDRKHGMTPRHLVVLIANKIADSNDSSPQPRLHCPSMFVGTWQQLDPSVDLAAPCLWHLEADGTFRSNDPSRLQSKFWCALRSYPSYSLQLARAPNERRGLRLFGATVENDELLGEYGLGARGIKYRLRRITSPVAR